MRVNVEKVLERDQKLSDLDDRAGEQKDGRGHQRSAFHKALHENVQGKGCFQLWTPFTPC